MTQSVQRASGTKSPADVLLGALGLRRRTQANDLDAVGEGVTLKVTCLIRPSDAKPKSIPINGSLLLRQGAEPVWQPYSKRGGHSLPGPLRVTGPSSGRFGSYAAFELNTAAGPVTAFVPKPDVPVLRELMRAAGLWAD